MTRFTSAFFIALFLVVTASAKQYAPLPPAILSAKTVMVINQTGAPEADDILFSELKKWGRFSLTTDKTKADLVIYVTRQKSEDVGAVVSPIGSDTFIIPYRNGSTTFSIYAGKNDSGELWTITRAWADGGLKMCIKEFKKRVQQSSQEKK